MIKIIEGGITAPKGYTVSGVSCGLKKDGQKDLAILTSKDIAVAAGVFTTNLIKSHSLQLTIEHIKLGYAKAVVINSGIANACIGKQGYTDAEDIASLTSKLLNCEPENILVGSTGIIGLPLNMPLVRSGIRSAISSLDIDSWASAAEAIMTTDTVPKSTAIELEIQDQIVRIGGMAKGSATVHPNMATMISIITTDVNISKGLLNRALKDVTERTFNRISTDGDTSISDMCLILANGEAENSGILKETLDYQSFVNGLLTVCTNLSKQIVRDGKNTNKLFEIVVENALNDDDAHKVASVVSKSAALKSSVSDEKIYWGGIVSAIGHSGADFEPNLLDLKIGDIILCRNGIAQIYENEALKKLLKNDELTISINLKRGKSRDRIWTCNKN